MQFANYFLSRKHTQSLKEVASLLQVLNTLTSSKVCILQLAGYSMRISSFSNNILSTH